jgi:hypothetical protein
MRIRIILVVMISIIMMDMTILCESSFTVYYMHFHNVQFL